MPFDAGLAAAVTKELKEQLCGAKIEKIQQPERDEIVLSLKIARETKRLLISAKAGSARLCVTRLEKENPQTPPMFCMLLRKYLSSARLIDVLQPDLERVAEFLLSSTNEMGDTVVLRLVCELIGNQANVILVYIDTLSARAINVIVFFLEIIRIVRSALGGNANRLGICRNVYIIDIMIFPKLVVFDITEDIV